MTYPQDVWSWQEHLRCGGTTTWRDWLLQDRARAAVPGGWSAPGAAQLELVRRLAVRCAGDPGGHRSPAVATVRFADLADLVTGRSGPGRGLGQQPLSWTPGGRSSSGGSPGTAATARPHRLGAPPVDPAEVPLEELVRVGVGVLTELLLDAGGPGHPGAAAEPAGSRRSRGGAGGRARLLRAAGRPGRATPFVLDGAPVTTSAVRRELAAAGYAEDTGAGAATLVVLLAEPFDQALAQAWSARVQRGAPARWAGFVARWSGRRELPPSVDLAALAGAWAGRVGAAQVHVVAPYGVQEAGRVTSDVLALLRPRRSRRPGAPPTARDRTAALAPAGVDTARRVNAVLGVRVAPPQRDTALQRLVQALPPGPVRMALTVPEPFHTWAHERAERLADGLRGGGYPVHGSLGAIVPGFDGLPTRPDAADTLEVVLTTCLGLVRLPASEGAGSGG